MSNRKVARKTKNEDENTIDDDEEEETDLIDNDVDTTDDKKINKKQQSSSKSSKGYNIPAIIIMLMFLLPGVIGAFLYLYDLYYPEAAALRKVRERVVRCYEVANPTKLSEVDKFIGKYKGRHHVLFAQLRSKYQKYPECN